MNDEPNIIDWKVGDLVSHDADAKCQEMLMIVVGIDSINQLYITKYINPKYTRCYELYKNDKKYLHDPARFGIKIPTIENIPFKSKESEKMERYWSISRAEYLTVPRSIIQEMPKEWQDQLADLLHELDECIDWHPKGEDSYWVVLGKYDEESNEVLTTPDPLKEYRHGNDYAKELIRKNCQQKSWEGD